LFRGQKNAYEIILMAYENGDLPTLQSHLANDVYEEFEATVTDRVNKGYKVDANFIGLREIRIRDVIFEDESTNAEITVFFKCELTSVVRDSKEIIVEGSSSKVKSHTDVWTFGRKIGTDDPSWKLIATGS
jgi:predicted lipid-binding transport protein (Tim44 family)